MDLRMCANFDAWAKFVKRVERLIGDSRIR